jgi:hypothetical protein
MQAQAATPKVKPCLNEITPYVVTNNASIAHSVGSHPPKSATATIRRNDPPLSAIISPLSIASTENLRRLPGSRKTLKTNQED